NIDILKTYINKYNPKFIYIMTNFQCPTTYSYSEEKKRKLISLANIHNFYIIEDDFLTDLSYRDKKDPLKSMDKNNKVIFIKNFSKIFMSGVRISFLTIPIIMFKEIRTAKHTTNISSSGYHQRTFDLYLSKCYWKNHMEKRRKVYNEK